MKVLNIRYNQATYFVFLAMFVATMVILVNVLENPPRMGEVILVLIAVPRLHDIGRSGWWTAVPLALEILLAGGLLARNIPMDDFMVAMGLFTLAMLGVLVTLGLVPGQKQPNEWGDPPPAGINWRSARRS